MSISYNRQVVRKERKMNEEMNLGEVRREETEQKMIYKFLLMIKESNNSKVCENCMSRKLSK